MNAHTNEVTTVALLARKQGISADLFSRYWRDVHGPLAVRIPGFWSYTQYHVSLVTPAAAGAADDFVMDGYAVVRFCNADDRIGLGSSDVTPLILRDERNVFSRTLLYSLAAGASVALIARPESAPDYHEPLARYAWVVRSEADNASAEAALRRDLLPGLQDSAGLTALEVHWLASGDPTQWQTRDGVDNAERGARNIAVIDAQWGSADDAAVALTATRASASLQLRAYRVTARCAMVAEGRPTHLGLRGLDVWRTLEEAGAANQKGADVLEKLFGRDLKTPTR